MLNEEISFYDDRDVEVVNEQPPFIEIYPTYLVINNVSSISNTKPLINYLSVWDKVNFRYAFSAYFHDEENDQMRIPASVDLNKVISHLGYSNLVVQDKRTPSFKRNNQTFKVSFKPRDEIQEKALMFLYDSPYHYDGYQRMLSLNTGDGKTFVAVKSLSISKRVPMVFVNTSTLLEQWKERIKDYTDLTDEHIYVISGRKSFDKLKEMTKREVKLYRFFIASHRTMQAIDHKEIEELFDHLDISLKVFDEAHLEYENIIKIDLSTNCPSLYLTATPSRTNQVENRLYQTVFSRFPRFSSDSKRIKKTKENYHTVAIVKYNTNPDIEDIAIIKKASVKRGFNIASYSKYILDKKFGRFYLPIRTILGTSIYPTNSSYIPKTLILVKQIEMINRLMDALSRDPILNLSSRVKIGTYHSKMSKADKENTLNECDLIITTDSSMSTGVDIPNLENMLSTIPTSSPVVTEQMLGRLRFIEGKNVSYYDVCDVGFPETVRQLNERVNKVYKRKAKNIYQTEIRFTKGDGNNG